MIEIIIPKPVLADLADSLQAETEKFAAVYFQQDDANGRLLLADFDVARQEELTSATSIEVTVSAEFLMRVTHRAREENLILGLLHTHLHGYKAFSATDDGVEQALKAFVNHRLPDFPVYALMLCDGEIIARKFATRESVNVRVVGAVVALPKSEESSTIPEQFDRQVRAFGADGQEKLARMRVAIVGLGGTGSVAMQQLAHLGVGSIHLIDPDAIEITNLNRVVGSNTESVGRPKVEVAANLIRVINPNAKISCHGESVVSRDLVAMLASCDCIFSCTDSHVSRAFLSEISYVYLVPVFDVGVAINIRDGEVSAVTGRAQMLAPGLPCLICSNSINGRAIREELMTPEERQADPYFSAGGVQQPAVISINSTMVSLAVTMFLAAFVGIPSAARWATYDAIKGTVRSVAGTSADDCPFCGSKEACAAGDSWPLSFLR